MMPSREFLVRQSCLNSAQKLLPLQCKIDGAAQALRYLQDHYAHDGSVFLDTVKTEFRKLVARHQDAGMRI